MSCIFVYHMIELSLGWNLIPERLHPIVLNNRFPSIAFVFFSVSFPVIRFTNKRNANSLRTILTPYTQRGLDFRNFIWPFRRPARGADIKLAPLPGSFGCACLFVNNRTIVCFCFYFCLFLLLIGLPASPLLVLLLLLPLEVGWHMEWAIVIVSSGQP